MRPGVGGGFELIKQDVELSSTSISRVHLPDLPNGFRTHPTQFGDFSLTELPLVEVLQDFLGLGFVQELVVRLSGVLWSTQLPSFHQVDHSTHFGSFSDVVTFHLVQ